MPNTAKRSLIALYLMGAVANGAYYNGKISRFTFIDPGKRVEAVVAAGLGWPIYWVMRGGVILVRRLRS